MTSPDFDPFARRAFYPDQGSDAAVTSIAREAIELARQEFRIELTFDVAGIASLDSIVSRLKARLADGSLSSDEALGYARKFGFFVGEVIRKTHGGIWGIGRLYSEQSPALRAGSAQYGIDIWPVSTVLGRIKGFNDQTVGEFCKSLATDLSSLQDGTQAAVVKSLIRVRDSYCLRHDNGYFDTGITSDQRQALMSFFWTGLTAIFFDSSGNLLGHEVRPLPAEPTFHPSSGSPLHTDEFDETVGRAMADWKRELGLVEQPIRVQRFEIDELGVGITDRPSYMDDFLNAPSIESDDEEDRQDRVNTVREWEADGSFVLYWGNDLWVNGSGEVTSS